MIWRHVFIQTIYKMYLLVCYQIHRFICQYYWVLLQFLNKLNHKLASKCSSTIMAYHRKWFQLFKIYDNKLELIYLKKRTRHYENNVWKSCFLGIRRERYKTIILTNDQHDRNQQHIYKSDKSMDLGNFSFPTSTCRLRDMWYLKYFKGDITIHWKCRLDNKSKTILYAMYM